MKFCSIYSAILYASSTIAVSASVRDFATIMFEDIPFASKDRLCEVLQNVHDVVRKMHVESGLWYHVLEMSGPSLFVDVVFNYIGLRQKTENQQRLELQYLQNSIQKLDQCAEDVINLVKLCEQQKKDCRTKSA